MAQVTCRRKGVLRRHRTPPQLRAAGNRPPSRGPRVCVKLSLVSVVCASRGCVRIWGRERALTRYPEPSHGRPRGPGPAQRVNNRDEKPTTRFRARRAPGEGPAQPQGGGGAAARRRRWSNSAAERFGCLPNRQPPAESRNHFERPKLFRSSYPAIQHTPHTVVLTYS